WLINYQHSKDTNFNSQFGPDGAYHTFNDIEQQGIQWHNQLHWSTFTINFGTEWRQEQITATGEHLVNRTYGLYTSLAYKWQSLMLESSLRADNYSQFNWQPTWQLAV